MRQAGFTLLEVLVALVVLGLVMAGLAQGTRFGLNVADRQSTAIAATADEDATDRVLRGLIAQMDPGTLTAAPLLQAGPASLGFTTDLAAVAPGAGVGLADVGIGLSAGRLVLRWTPHVHAASLGAAPPAMEAVLLPDVSGVAFAYWNGTAWLATWPDRTLPALVRVTLTFPAATRRVWPPLIAAPVRQRLNG